MRRFSLLILILLTLLSSVVFADETYPRTGGIDQVSDLTSTDGLFNDALPSNKVATYGFPITKSQFNPLVGDLDGNGDNELVIYDAPLIYVYANSTMQGLAQYNIGESNITPILYDVDGDGRLDIVTVTQPNMVFSLLNLINRSYLNVSFTNGMGISGDLGKIDKGIMACRAANKCLLAGTFRGSTANYLIARTFNGSSLANFNTRNTLHISTSTSNAESCFSSTPIIQVVDYDNDGLEEYVFSTIQLGDNVDPDLENGVIKIWVLNDNNPTPVVELNSASGITDDLRQTGGTGKLCTTYNPSAHNVFTNPLVLDINGFYNFIIGIMNSDTTFKLRRYDSSGSLARTYPALGSADGSSLSNTFRMNIFSDASSPEFCAMGFLGYEISLLCGSTTRSFLGFDDSEIYTGSSSMVFQEKQQPFFNGSWSSMVHATQQSHVFTEGIDLDELAGTFGILRVDEVNNELDFIYGGGVSPNFYLPLSFQKDGYDDILVKDVTNVLYLDYLFTNQKASVAPVSINPCNDAIWQLNTSVTVSFRVNDDEGDTVQARAVLYSGEQNYQDSEWSNNMSAGGLAQFSFVANVSTGSSTLRLYGRDSANYVNVSNDFEDISFSVQSVGINYNDCVSDLTETTGGTNSTGDDGIIDSGTGAGSNLRNNSISNGLDFFQESSGLGKGIWWLIIMAVIGVVIFYEAVKAKADLKGTSVIMIIVEILLLLVGTYLGFISPIVVVLLALLIIVVVVLFFWKSSTGD